MTAPLNLATIGQAPKALLHDHLDGGLRPATVLELADVYAEVRFAPEMHIERGLSLDEVIKPRFAVLIG